MNPIHFPAANAVFAKDQPQYRQLPAHRDREGVVTSCWKLSLRERLSVLLTGRLYISAMTFNTAPQPILPRTAFTPGDYETKLP